MTSGPDLSSPAGVRAVLNQFGLHPRKRLGQHFLVDHSVLQRIVEVAAVPAGGLVLEIGPGLGTLTRELAARSAGVAAIEADREMFQLLQEAGAPEGHLRLLHGDAVRILKSNPIPALFENGECLPGVKEITGPSLSVAPDADIRCVSNLPYGITSPALSALLEQKRWLRSIVVMVQKEVADRLTAAPGSAAYGALTVFVQFHAVVRLVCPVSRICFYPAPAVDSAVVHLAPELGGTVAVHDPSALFAISRALFGQRRKTSANALLALPGRPARETVLAALEKAGVDPAERGERLTLQQMAGVADALRGVI